jgi:hypothetical protein
MTIYVYSFDFDGCLFNSNYREIEAKSNLLEANQYLISQLSETIKKTNAHQVVLMVGSNRQSKRIDDLNHGLWKGSCFPALNKLSEAFKNLDPDTNRIYRVDPYLLADTFGKRPAGENFKQAINGNTTPASNYFINLFRLFEQKYLFSSCFFDESKFLILYSQMHKLASENPHDNVVFHFYDDQQHAILDNLHSFFTQHPNLMPHNLTLHLHHYAGESISNMPSIKGNGEIDADYQESIKSITQLCFEYDENRGNILQQLTQENNQKLNQFITQRTLKKFSSQEITEECLTCRIM